MSIAFEHIPHRRQIIDRRALADQLAELCPDSRDSAALRARAAPVLRTALAEGRAEIARRLAASPSRGSEIAASYAFLTDQILRLIYDFTTERLYPISNPSDGERLSLVAVGGYGRGEMALFSDVDIAFVTPWKQTSWCEQVIEAILYQLWDLGLKVGHSSRSLDDAIRMAKADLTIRTALLESRYVWGDEALFDQLDARFRREVVAATTRSFVTEKLAEREQRHQRMGDSRYVVEPNLKEGKGGLRDLHTLFWIGKYVYQVQSTPELVDKGLLRRRGISPLPARREFPVGRALPSPRRRRARRGAADVRRPARGRDAAALCRSPRQDRGRALHAALFPHREAGGGSDPGFSSRISTRPSRRAGAASACRSSSASPRTCGASCSIGAASRCRTKPFSRKTRSA